jgi:hypothetical protein
VTHDSNGAATAAPAGLPAVNDTSDLAEVDRWLLDATASIPLITDVASALEALARVKMIEHAVQIQKLGEERERAWAGVKLRAERRYGELLPPKQPGRRTSNKPLEVGGDAMAQSRARKVADDVPEEVFEEYVKDDPKPTRAGLHRAAAKAKPKPPPEPVTTPPRQRTQRPFTGSPSVCDDPAVIKWVYDREMEGVDRPRQIAASHAKTDGWPVPDDELSNGTHSTAMCVIRWMLKEGYEPGGDNAPAVRKRRAAARIKDIKRRQKAGDLSHLGDVLFRMVQVTDMLESLDIAEYDFDRDEVQDEMRELLDELADLNLWSDMTLDRVRKYLDDQDLISKINHAREAAKHPSMDEVERRAWLAGAERLEARLERRVMERQKNGHV